MTRSRRKFKFNKAFVGRLVAVGLFVLLGSVAVMQSIRQAQKAKDPDSVVDDHDHDHDDEATNPTAEPNLLTDASKQEIQAKPISFNQETDPAASSNTSQTNPRTDSLPTANAPSQFGDPPIVSAKSQDQSLPLIDSNTALPGQSNPASLTIQGSSIGDGPSGQFGAPPTLPRNPPYSTFQFSDTDPTGIGNPASQSLPSNSSLTDQQAVPNSAGGLPQNSFPNHLTSPASKTTRPNQLSTLPNNGFPDIPDSLTQQDVNPAKQQPQNAATQPFPGVRPQQNSLPANNQWPPQPRAVQSQTNPTQNQSSADLFDNNLRNPSRDTSPTQSLPQNGLPNPIQQDNSLPNVLPRQNALPDLPSTSSFPGNSLPGNNVSPVQPVAPPTIDTKQAAQTQAPFNSGFPGSVSPLDTNNTNDSNSLTIPTNPVSIPASTVSNIRKVEGIQTPSLTLQKLAPREITVNQVSDFEIIVRNVGKTTAENVTVHDRIPSNVEVVRMDPQPVSNQGGSVTWNLGSIEPGKVMRIQMKLKPVAPGEIGSIAQVTFTSRAGARTRITKPILRVTHSAPPKTLIGRYVPLQIVVENTGNGPARNVIIQERVPANLTFEIRGKPEKEIEYAIGTLGPGQKRSITLRLKATQVGKVQNLMVAHGEGGLRAQHVIGLEITAPNLGVESKGPKRRFLGRPAEHEFTVKNTGSAAATNVDLVARLPRGLRFVNANHHGQYQPASHSVIWRLDQLESGVMGKVNITTTPMENGNQTIQFSATADLGQKESTQQTMLVYQVAELYFDINDEADALEIGTETVYNIRVVNRGSKAATNVRLAVEFAPGIKPIQIDGVAANGLLGQSISLPLIKTLGPRQQRVFQIRARGVTAGEHRIVASLSSDERKLAVKKEDSTHVYSDQ